MRILTLALTLLLAGCAAGLDASFRYEMLPVHDIAVDGHNWRIFDNAPQGKLMITPSFGRSLGAGFMSGLTFGGLDTDIPKPEYQSAVAAWLRQSGRRCTITDGYKLVRPQWEFTYRCA